MGVESVELEIGGQSATVLAEPGQQLARLRFFADLERPRASHLDFDVIAFSKTQRLHHRRRQTNRQTVTPFRDLHMTSTFGYT